MLVLLGKTSGVRSALFSSMLAVVSCICGSANVCNINPLLAGFARQAAASFRASLWKRLHILSAF